MLNPCYIICGTQHRTMSGDFFTHNDRQPCISTYSTLKWDSTGELSELDMDRILGLLEKAQPEVTQMGMSNPRWKNGSVMQE